MKKIGPCLEKKCSDCCDPVKMPRFMPEEKIPKDAEGKPLWTKRRELLVPEDQERTKLETYDCKNFDPETGKCKDYENRPEICKNSGCVNPESEESVEEQHRKMKETKFMKIR